LFVANQVPNSDFSYAFVVTQADENFRRVAPTLAQHDPANAATAAYAGTSYYHKLGAYAEDAAALAALRPIPFAPVPGDVVSNGSSTFKITPASLCDPLQYLALDLKGGLTAAVNAAVNGPASARDDGCEVSGTLLRPWAIADVKLTLSLEKLWRARAAADVADVVWTYIGTQSGISRVFPGHQTAREYDPTVRPWYHKGAVARGVPTVSTPYLDAFGAGKVVTLTQAIFEGTDPATTAGCVGGTAAAAAAAGCACAVGLKTGAAATGDVPAATCSSAYCFEGRCAHERVEGVLGLDFTYKTFENRVFSHTWAAKDATSGRSCNSTYACSRDGVKGTCLTECYVLDENAHLVVHHKLGEAPAAAEVDYHDLSLGEFEGELVRRFNALGLLAKQEYYDYQGVCYHTPPREMKAHKVAPHRSAQAQDEAKSFDGYFPPFSNAYGCQKHVLVHKLSTPTPAPTQSGTYEGPCSSGAWTLTPVPGVKLFLLVVDGRRDLTTPGVFDISCHISNALHRPGTFHAVRDTCARVVDSSKSKLQAQCMKHLTVDTPCKQVAAGSALAPGSLAYGLALLALCVSAAWQR